MSISSGLVSSWQQIQRIYTEKQGLPVTIDAESSADTSEYIEANWLEFGGEKKEGINTNATSLLLANFRDSNR